MPKSSQVNMLIDLYPEIDNPRARIKIKEVILLLLDDLLDSENRLTQQEINIAQNQGKIACIKMLRARLNLNLQEAKDFVENEATRLGFTFYGY
jgi:ribosomal protein L7/L12